MLEKQAKELAKQKENTTKLSKLCLGTLNELEKFEKKQVLVKNFLRPILLIVFSRREKLLLNQRTRIE